MPHTWPAGEPGRVDESILSRVSALRTKLHEWIYRRSPIGKFRSVEACLDVLPISGPHGSATAAELANLSQLLAPLSELLTAESEAGVRNKLLNIRLPTSAAQWIWEGDTGCEVRFEYQIARKCAASCFICCVLSVVCQGRCRETVLESRRD